MILEFENYLLLFNIGLNLLYNDEVDFMVLDRVILKKILVIFVMRKESFLVREKFKEKWEMFGRYFDDYDSYEDDFDDESFVKEFIIWRFLWWEFWMFERVWLVLRLLFDLLLKYWLCFKKVFIRRDLFVLYRSVYGINRGKLFLFDFFCCIVIFDMIFINIRFFNFELSK